MVEIGQLIRGKYRLVRLLGDGGMGTVYEAMHEGLGTRVAIKVLHADLARRSGLVERFLREARVSAQIKSTNVVQVMDVDRTEQGDAYIVMELLEGEPMSSLLERERRVAIPIAVDYTGQILRALEAAHALGIVHRDLKPENVFVTYPGGKPLLKLIDFGIAKAHLSDPGAKNLTVAGVVMGTAEYMAPEQAHSADKVDARSDLYAVGVMLYELIAGQRPVSGEDARIIAVRVERGDVTPLVHVAPDVPRELAGLVHRAMAARPELRFASAAEMRLSLETLSTGGAKPRSPTVPLGGGTVLGAPSPDVRGAKGKTVPGGGAPEGVAHGSYVPAVSAAGSSVGGLPTNDRTRRRKRSSGWLLIALPLLLGGGVVLALVVNNASSSPAPVATTTTTTTTTATATATPTPTPTPSPAANDTVAPLIPTPTAHPPRPHPTASGGASAPPQPTETVPSFPSSFPTSFPSGIPNPFPNASSSGVSPVPVFTIPTNLPFPMPPFTVPTAPTSAPSATPPPSPSAAGY